MAAGAPVDTGPRTSPDIEDPARTARTTPVGARPHTRISRPGTIRPSRPPPDPRGAQVLTPRPTRSPTHEHPHPGNTHTPSAVTPPTGRCGSKSPPGSTHRLHGIPRPQGRLGTALRNPPRGDHRIRLPHTTAPPSTRSTGPFPYPPQEPRPTTTPPTPPTPLVSEDLVRMMRILGHTRSTPAGHDHENHIAFRPAPNHPDPVSHPAPMDYVPINEHLAHPADAKARAAELIDRTGPEPSRKTPTAAAQEDTTDW